jgi:hypothetical protein
MFLKGYCGRECSNDLDLIYGVLGCLLHTKKSNLRLTITSTWKTFLLGSLGNAWSKGASRSFPEAINWMNGAQSLQGCLLGCQTGELNEGSSVHWKEMCFSAANGVAPLLILNSQSPRKVAIKGTLVDTVKVIATSQFASWKQWKLSELQSYISNIRSLHKTQQLGLPPGNAESVEPLFARLLVYDCRKDVQMDLLRSSDPDYLLIRLLDFDDYVLNDISKLADRVTQSLEEFGCQA